MEATTISCSIGASKEECSDLVIGSSFSASSSVILSERKIKFHLATKPFNGFKSCGRGDFRIETLNPGPDPKRVNGVGSGQVGVTGRKVDGADMLENGYDPVLSLRTTFRKIVSFLWMFLVIFFIGYFLFVTFVIKFCVVSICFSLSAI